MAASQLPRLRPVTTVSHCTTPTAPWLKPSSGALLTRTHMGRPFKQYLNGPRIYSCANCRAHAADHDDIISKSFTGRHGRAFLLHNVVNVCLGPKEERVLITGLHTVADIHCTVCDTVLGWKYEYAFEPSQKYKEGKFIVEKARVLKDGDW